jgi:hypothetical protein
VSDIYVQAASADVIDSVQADLEEALPMPRCRRSPTSPLGVGVALDGVDAHREPRPLAVDRGARRGVPHRDPVHHPGRHSAHAEFGTLKAIGWSNRRITGQVAGESLVQGLIGGVAGLALGLVGIWIVNLISPTLAGSTARRCPTASWRADPAALRAADRSALGEATAPATAEVVLNAPGHGSVSPRHRTRVLGGLLAGAIGGWRAARLRPAEALRSVA